MPRPFLFLQLTLEEVMTTTAYLDLFLRSVSEPALLQTFLSFILLHRHESVHVLDTLVSRINTPFQVNPAPTLSWSRSPSISITPLGSTGILGRFLCSLRRNEV